MPVDTDFFLTKEKCGTPIHANAKSARTWDYA